MSKMTNVKNLVYDKAESMMIRRARRAEIAKFRNPKRKAILSHAELSKRQMHDIDEFYLENYGTKIPYTWHQHNLAVTGNFDVRFFPELLFIPEFERYMNQPIEYARVFEDKNLLRLFADKAGVRVPKSLLSRVSGIYFDSDMKEISEHVALEMVGNMGKCFAKPTVGTCSGQGCGAYEFDHGIDARSGLKAKDLFGRLGVDFSIQEIVSCHSSVANLHPESVNTLRVMTYRWKDELRVLPLLMRIGRGESRVDNAHAGGIFIGVSNQGILSDSALNEFNDRYDRHPDTGIVFGGYEIAGVGKVIDAAKGLHSLMPQMGIISWDFTVDEDGNPLVIEANIKGGSIWLPQMASGLPAFGDETAEILRWLKFMNKKAPHDRRNFKFGYKG